jgi:uncharacterized membrane protein YkvA (DUF1232 family)
MLRRLLSFQNWVHVFKKFVPLLFSGKVPFREKLLFVIPALVYWVAPDLFPFMPVDDIAVSLILMNFFTNRVEKKYNLK